MDIETTYGPRLNKSWHFSARKSANKFDEIILQRGYSSCSEGVSDAIRSYIVNFEWMSDVQGKRVGVSKSILTACRPWVNKANALKLAGRGPEANSTLEKAKKLGHRG